LDSVDPEEFARMSGKDRKLERVLAGLDAAVAAGLSPVKLNCVVIRGRNEQAVLPLARRFRGTPHVVRFIEYMDVGTRNHWRLADVVPAREILAQIGAESPLVPVAPSHPGEVAQRFRYADGSGEIGVISSVTQPFCGSCNRARLSADGRLLTCLFAAGGTDLRRVLRAGASDAELRALLLRTWHARSDRYSELRAEAEAAPEPTGERSSPGARRRLEMYQIGG
jgi:cyclic pyranopterin phosphate synthase